MSDSSQIPGPAERYPYISLQEWLEVPRPGGALETALYVSVSLQVEAR
jgi:hypothetical protein